MPLIHSKTPKAFKKNIETEMEHGKPQKQAVAIAYSEKRAAEHKHAGGGKICMACGGMPCKEMMEQSGTDDVPAYAEGGEAEEYESDHMEPDADDIDDEISEALGHELMNAFEAKDPKKIMEALEACVLACSMKGGM